MYLCLSQQLLMEIKKVNFTVNTTQIFFNASGDPSFGYDIVYWNMTESKQHADITDIGEYWPDRNITIPDDVRDMQNVNVRLKFHHIFMLQNNLGISSCTDFVLPFKGNYLQLP